MKWIYCIGLSQRFWLIYAVLRVYLVVFTWIGFCTANDEILSKGNEVNLEPKMNGDVLEHRMLNKGEIQVICEAICMRSKFYHSLVAGHHGYVFNLHINAHYNEIWMHSSGRKRLYKRSSNFQIPYRIEVSEISTPLAEMQEFSMKVSLLDQKNSAVTLFDETQGWEILLTPLKDDELAPQAIKGNLTAVLRNGRTEFNKIKFLTSGNSFRLRLTLRSTERQETNSDVSPWTSRRLEVTPRPLFLKPASDFLPHNPRENDTFAPAAGVVIYDQLTGKPLGKKYLYKYTWEANISLLYDDIYPGELLGTTRLLSKGNRIIFSDIIITAWGYSYILKITVTSLESSHWSMECLIGPFDVDMVRSFELPLVESLEYRDVVIAFDGDFSQIQKNAMKFTIFFLNTFGVIYDKVKWRNVTVTEGSVIIGAVINGLTENLEETSSSLAQDILSGKADIEYFPGKIWKASSIHVPTRKLLQEKSGNQGQKSEDSSETSEGLPVAWIAAIAINVVLLTIFILVVIYCYCKRRKKRRDSEEGTIDQTFRGDPEILFVDKAATNGTEKTALIGSESPNVFIIEDERRKHGISEDDDVDMFSHSESRARCTCNSPECYCSVGDYYKEKTPKTEPILEEPEPESYHATPEPEPFFSSPEQEEPEPNPEPEDFWRPDSNQYREEEDDQYLPGAVTQEPEPLPEKRYLVYAVTDEDGSRDCIGHVMIPDEGTPTFLNDFRHRIQNSALSLAIGSRNFSFLTDNLKELTFQENSMTVDRIYPSQVVNIKFEQPIKKKKRRSSRPKIARRQELPAYVGPLGLCGAEDCVNPARIKCLDCGNVAYCSTRCKRDDTTAHRKICYKPAWRV